MAPCLLCPLSGGTARRGVLSKPCRNPHALVHQSASGKVLQMHQCRTPRLLGTATPGFWAASHCPAALRTCTAALEGPHAPPARSNFAGQRRSAMHCRGAGRGNCPWPPSDCKRTAITRGLHGLNNHLAWWLSTILERRIVSLPRARTAGECPNGPPMQNTSDGQLWSEA